MIELLPLELVLVEEVVLEEVVLVVEVVACLYGCGVGVMVVLICDAVSRN